ncbi:hypothetical protein L7F22_049139 [Adiantum nelumboides]|nr:hypothetical protein [Adiantum nelumboides]
MKLAVYGCTSSPSTVEQKSAWGLGCACRKINGHSKAAKRRRRSRAKPTPPTTQLAARDPAHFKAIVHHFTSIGRPLDHSLLLPHCPGIVFASPAAHMNTMTGSLSSPFPAHKLCGSTIAESLKFSLRTIFSCLELLHKSNSSSSTCMTSGLQMEADIVMQALTQAGVFQSDEEPSTGGTLSRTGYMCLRGTHLDETMVHETYPPFSLGDTPLMPATCFDGNCREDTFTLASELALCSPEDCSSMQESKSKEPSYDESCLESFFTSKGDANVNIMSQEDMHHMNTDEELIISSPLINSPVCMKEMAKELESFLQLENSGNKQRDEDCSFEQIPWQKCSSHFAPLS